MNPKDIQVKKQGRNSKPYRAEVKDLKQQLLEERLFSESLIASLPGFFFMLDENGRYQRWTKNLEKILGYTPEEIQNRDARDLVPPEDKERILKAVENGFRKGSFSVEYSNVSKDGRKIPFYGQS
jgi:PAS domain S-box-containing protein